MKNKKMTIGTALFLFVLIGICNIVSVSAETVELPPTSYWARGFEVDHQDKLEITVSSNGLINTYIMNEEQIDILTDSGGLTWSYIIRWKDMTYLEYTYTIPADGAYYVVLYNKDIFYGRTVDIQVNIDHYYEPYDPLDLSDRYFLERLFWWLLIIFVPIGVVVIIAVVLVKKHKRKAPSEPIVQIKDVPKGMLFCHECGALISDKRKFCSNCGTEIILN